MSVWHTFQALADPNRQTIIAILKKKKELPVNAILKELSITGASLSHHLAILKQAGVVSSRRRGQQVLYSLNLSVFEELMAELAKFVKP